MKTILKRGYMWKCYGFTRTHIWGVHLVGGCLLAGAGMATLMIAALGIVQDSLFWKTIAVSACLFLASIATLLGSILSLIFYAGASRLGLLEGSDNRDAEPAPPPYSSPAAGSESGEA